MKMVNRQSKAISILFLLVLCNLIQISMSIRSNSKMFSSNKIRKNKNSKILLKKSNIKESTNDTKTITLRKKASRFLSKLKRRPDFPWVKYLTLLTDFQIVEARNVLLDYCLDLFDVSYGVRKIIKKGMLYAEVDLFSTAKFFFGVLWKKIVTHPINVDYYVSQLNLIVNSPFQALTSFIASWFKSDEADLKSNPPIEKVINNENMLKNGKELKLTVPDECTKFVAKDSENIQKNPLQFDASKFDIDLSVINKKDELIKNVITGFIEQMLMGLLPISNFDVSDDPPREIAGIKFIGLNYIVRTTALSCAANLYATFKPILDKITNWIKKRIDSIKKLISILNQTFEKSVGFKPVEGLSENEDIGEPIKKHLDDTGELKDNDKGFFKSLLGCFEQFGDKIIDHFITATLDFALQLLTTAVDVIITSIPGYAQFRGVFNAVVSVYDIWGIVSFSIEAANAAYSVAKDVTDSLNVTELIPTVVPEVHTDKMIKQPPKQEISPKLHNNPYYQFGKKCADFSVMAVKAILAFFNVDGMTKIINLTLFIALITYRLVVKDWKKEGDDIIKSIKSGVDLKPEEIKKLTKTTQDAMKEKVKKEFKDVVPKTKYKKKKIKFV